MKLLVLGARGMLGTDLMVAADDAGHETSGFGRAELDVTRADELRRRFEEEIPDVVINCAAWTDVDGAEDDHAGAMAVNGVGAVNAASAAAEIGAKILYVSTDYVFDGTKGSDYVESDPVAPINVYGQTKREGEQATVAANSRSWVVRSSWLFGLNGPNFVETMLRLGGDRGEVQVVRDQIGSPTWTRHLSRGLIELLESDAYGTVHMTGAGRCSWYEFAREIFAQAGADVVTRPVTTSEMGRKARRPAWSALASELANPISLPRWQEGLAGYLAGREISGKEEQR